MLADAGTPTWVSVLVGLVALSGPLVAYLSYRNTKHQAGEGEHRLTMNDLNSALNIERTRLAEERDELRTECATCRAEVDELREQNIAVHDENHALRLELDDLSRTVAQQAATIAILESRPT